MKTAITYDSWRGGGQMEEDIEIEDLGATIKLPDHILYAVTDSLGNVKLHLPWPYRVINIEESAR